MADELVAGLVAFDDLVARLRRLEELLAGASGEPLQVLVSAAAQGIPGASAVSITTMRRGQLGTVAASSQRARDADQLQHTLASGPSVQAVLDDEICHPCDLARDSRWPLFGPRVVAEVGFHSCLSYPLNPDPVREATTPPTAQHPPEVSRPFTTGNGTTGNTVSGLIGYRSSLTVYGDTAGVFSPDALVTGLVFATSAVSLITSSHAQETHHHLEQALASSRQIGVALGILMHARQLTQDEAFTVLRRASQNSNRKLSDLAAELAHTGALPSPTRRAHHLHHVDHRRGR